MRAEGGGLETSLDQLRAKISRFEDFLAQDPDNFGLLSELAELYYQAGDFEKANQLIDTALTKQPHQPSLEYLKANVAMASGQPLEAVTMLQGLLEAGNDAPAIHHNLAYAYLYAGQALKAKQQLDLITAEIDQMPEAALLRARVLHHTGELAEGIASAEAYLNMHPGATDAMGVLSLLQYDAGNIAAARNWAEQAIQTDNRNLEARVVLGSIALDRQDKEPSRRHFSEALAAHPKSGRAWSGLGMAEMLGMNLDQALHGLEKAVEYMPNHIGTWHALAWCQIVRDDIAGAKHSLEAAMALDHNFGESHGGLAVIDILQGHPADAEIKVKKALRLNSASFSAMFAQSLLKEQAGKPEEARQLIQQIFASRIGGDSETLQHKIMRQLRNFAVPPSADKS